MSEALQIDSAVTNVIHSNTQSEGKPLNQCVQEAMSEYFRHLEGHPSGDLYKMVMGEVEEPLFRAVLEYTGGNQSKASDGHKPWLCTLV